MASMSGVAGMSGNRGNPMNIQQRTTEDLSALPNDWPECIRKIMAARGIKKADELTFDLAELPKPSEMLGMEAAVTFLIAMALPAAP